MYSRAFLFKKKVSTQLFNTRLKMWRLKVDRAINSLYSLFIRQMSIYTREKELCVIKVFAIAFFPDPQQLWVPHRKSNYIRRAKPPYTLSTVILDLYCSICIAVHTHRLYIDVRQDLHNVFKFV
jgi:hypothetical protein